MKIVLSFFHSCSENVQAPHGLHIFNTLHECSLYQPCFTNNGMFIPQNMTDKDKERMNKDIYNNNMVIQYHNITR